MIENYVVIDLEMTGLNAKTDAILEVGAVRVREGKVQDTYACLLRTEHRLPQRVTELTGITEAMAAKGNDPEKSLAEFFTFIGEDVLVGQNVIFDYSFLKQWAVNHKFSFERRAADTLKLARKFLPQEQKKDLESLCVYFGIERRNAHRALDDALETWQIFERLKLKFGAENEDAFLPRELVYKAKRQTPATARQIEYLCQYARHFGLEVPEDFEEMTRSAASKLTDQWIACYGKLPRG